MLAAVAGCGSQSLSAARPDSGAPAATRARCITPKLIPPARTVTLTERDNGKSYCVQAGTGIFVFLHGTPTHLWAPISPTSAVIQRRPSGVMSLARGVTGGYFLAAELGSTALTSTLPPCRATGGGTPAPGTPHCTARTVFRVTVLVRGRM